MSLEVGSIEVTGDQADVALLMKIDPALQHREVSLVLPKAVSPR